jgi:preprotein translocase subunit SecY
MEAHSVKPDLWVLECYADTFPIKLLVACRIAVILKTELDEFPLIVSEKFGRGGIVVDEEVSAKGGDDRQ